MKSTDIPGKIETPFASRASVQFVTNPVPEAPPGSGHASWQGGFPPENFLPVGSGGIPPWGEDMNGVLLAMSNWNRWQGAGGQVGFDADFAANVGGYPRGALLLAATRIGWFLSLVDDNSVNPDTAFAAANWAYLPLPQVSNGDPNGSVAGKAGGAGSPPNLCWDTSLRAWWFCTSTGPASGAGQAVWAPLANMTNINAVATGANYNYTAQMLGSVQVRANSGAAMSDTLPATVNKFWSVSILNGDAVATLTLHVPAGASLNGVLNGSIDIGPKQGTVVNKDASGNFWLSVPPIPAVFSGQAIYVNASGNYPPGVYDLDSSGGPFTFTLETGGVDGDNYTFRDVGGALAVNNVTIASGLTIAGSPAPLLIDVNWSEFTLSRKSGDWSLA